MGKRTLDTSGPPKQDRGAGTWCMYLLSLAMLLVPAGFSMAKLLSCPECDRDVSSFADACPNCGMPTSRMKKVTPEPISTPSDINEVFNRSKGGLYRGHAPRRWKCQGGTLSSLGEELKIEPTSNSTRVEFNAIDFLGDGYMEVEVTFEKPDPGVKVMAVAIVNGVGTGGEKPDIKPAKRPDQLTFTAKLTMNKPGPKDTAGFRLIFEGLTNSAIINDVVVRLPEQKHIPTPTRATHPTGDHGAMNSLVLIETERGKGSGFLATMDGKDYVVSNQHVIRGSRSFSFRTAFGKQRIKPLSLEVAEQGDLVRFQYDNAQLKDAQPLASVLATGEVRIGDNVTVLGNSMGAGAVTRLDGKVLGVGPDRIEVSAPFVPGNSGSPILSSNGGVLGVASYIQRGAPEDWVHEGTRFSETRRFGYTLRPDLVWRKLSPRAYYRQSAILHDVETFYDEIATAIADLKYMQFGKVNYQGTMVERDGTSSIFIVGEYDGMKARENYISREWTTYLTALYGQFQHNPKIPVRQQSQRDVERRSQAFIAQIEAMVDRGSKALGKVRWSSGYLNDDAERLNEYGEAIRNYVNSVD